MDVNEKKAIQNMLTDYKDSHRQVQEKLEELKEEEQRLKGELEKVRAHLSYYDSLVTDMKKKMEGRKTTSIFDYL